MAVAIHEFLLFWCGGGKAGIDSAFNELYFQKLFCYAISVLRLSENKFSSAGGPAKKYKYSKRLKSICMRHVLEKYFSLNALKPLKAERNQSSHRQARYVSESRLLSWLSSLVQVQGHC